MAMKIIRVLREKILHNLRSGDSKPVIEVRDPEGIVGATNEAQLVGPSGEVLARVIYKARGNKKREGLEPTAWIETELEVRLVGDGVVRPVQPAAG